MDRRSKKNIRLIVIFSIFHLLSIFGFALTHSFAQQIANHKLLSQEFFDAIYENDYEVIHDLIKKGMDVNLKDEFGQTPLHISQNKDIIALLIEHGADLNARDFDFRMTPLFNKDLDGLQLLLAAGANIHVKSAGGNTPLIWFSYSNHLEGIKLLVQHGADIFEKNNDGNTALDIAQQWHYVELENYLKNLIQKKTFHQNENK